MITIGGGEILDAGPAKHRSSDRSVIEKLTVFKHREPDKALITVIEEAGLGGIGVSTLAARRGMLPSRVRSRLLDLTRNGVIRMVSDNPVTVVSQTRFNSAADAAVVAIRRFHQANPLAQGIGREELRARSSGDASSLVFNALLEQLIADKKVSASQDVVHDFGRQVTLKAEEEQMRVRLLERFKSLGLQVSTVDQVIDSLKLDKVTARKIVQLMLKEHALVKISEEMVIDRGVLDKLIADVRALKSKAPKLGVTEFKDLTGISRKYAIPLLEYLDRQRVTRRIGDERTIL